jgi:LacI family transcriptional regulator
MKTNLNPSMRDVAREAGVSVSAVSLALRNSPKVSEQRRVAIEKIAERMGYIKDGRISELMEHMRTNRSERQMQKLGVVIPEITKASLSIHSNIRGLVSGMEQQGKESGYGIDYFYLEDLNVSPKRLKGILESRGIRAIVLMPFRYGVGILDMDFSSFCISTAGYSIIDPLPNRACPNYLQMMDELIEQACRLGYKRIGFIMTYGQGGIGHKLFSSSFLYYSMLINESQRIPILPRRDISPENVKKWMDDYKPDVVISSRKVFHLLKELGYQVPDDLGFASLDISDDSGKAAGMDHRYDLVGKEALKLVISDLIHNNRGIPKEPRIVLVDSHYREGETLRKVGAGLDIRLRSTAYHDSVGEVKIVR